MKKNIYTVSLLSLILSGCININNSSSLNDTFDYKIIAPTGAPSVAFLSYLNNSNFETNSVPNNIVAEMLKDTKDIVVVDVIGGLNAIQNKKANYKLASIITFGNFYIYATGNDENKVMESEDNIVCFGQNNTPDKLFSYLYPNIGVDYYLAGVSDVAPIAASGKIEGENVDYCIIAEPVLTKVLSNKNAATYGKGYMYSDFQEEWINKNGENSSVLGAAVFVKNDLLENNNKQLNKFLNELKEEINNYIVNPSNAYQKLIEYGSDDDQTQKIGLNAQLVKTVLENSNSINLGYLDSSNSNFVKIINKYLNVINPSLINEENYIINEK